jgi:hypothetical protein
MDRSKDKPGEGFFEGENYERADNGFPRCDSLQVLESLWKSLEISFMEW